MADVLAVRDEYRTQQWAMVVQECAASGLSNEAEKYQNHKAEEPTEETFTVKSHFRKKKKTIIYYTGCWLLFSLWTLHWKYFGVCI